ncbi:RNA polymerase sigma-70 factor [Carboxylicivirga sp. A043]|uniref:RNA polymerase sigma-70 factor n=1 Tax=Carboxylicivirga litoralis TaxID=2816963 RepID=UPI0021CB698A|nr:RNA polymerase sigma-70 factor [Carboxylicivirga sp. A043]MCU4156181.1 RNA polymerase sigma-70 factor [Carboxylicivirga sp. A043]
MQHQVNDIELIKGIERGDEAAFQELFLKYYAQLVVFARKVVVDDDLARELVQDVIVNFYEKRGEIKIHSSLKAHLYQSVRNRCLNQIKHSQIRRDHHANIYLSQKNTEAYVDDKLEETELEQKIFSIIQTLPAQCKKIFEMSRFEGVTNQEIADKLELSKRTVETQISKALKVLRTNLAGYLDVWAFILWLFFNN